MIAFIKKILGIDAIEYNIRLLQRKNYWKEKYGTRKSQRSLKAWGKQKWRTKSGKKSSETGERYLPEKAIKSLSSAEYAATTKAKRQGTKKGKQFVKQPKVIAKKVKQYRRFS